MWHLTHDALQHTLICACVRFVHFRDVHVWHLCVQNLMPCLRWLVGCSIVCTLSKHAVIRLISCAGHWERLILQPRPHIWRAGYCISLAHVTQRGLFTPFARLSLLMLYAHKPNTAPAVMRPVAVPAARPAVPPRMDHASQIPAGLWPRPAQHPP